MKRAIQAVATTALCFLVSTLCMAGALIIDHNDIDITQLTEADINRAKAVLHIAYGHTSHGSQITDGMSGLVGFANGGGLGMSFSNNIFAWNNGGTGGALDLHDYAMGGDVGGYPQWYNNTITYLENPANSDVNVIMWSWCGQMPGKYAGGTLTNDYLAPMSALEATYTNVTFIYMTGHTDIWDDANQKAACDAIRNYCIENDKVLFDFSDIEHYNPDGTFFEFVNDTCDYYAYAGGSSLGNWATEWQGSHVQNVDWYSCGSQHSQPLNANMKAYAIWKLWCELGRDLDRDGIPDEWEERYGNPGQFGPASTNDFDHDGVPDWEEYVADTDPTNNASRFRIGTLGMAGACNITFDCTNSRLYWLESSPSLITGTWSKVDGQTNITGDAGGSLTLNDDGSGAHKYYRIGVEVP
ncbi:MAG: hypothetical protein EOM20_08690 [Spartobacteria bacterium]|nr:hypothetical protein [Spartobacteria bacterium]